MTDINHVQHARLKINYTMYEQNRITAIKKLLGNDAVIVLITESDVITDDECIIVDVDYVKISDVLIGENGCIRYIRRTDLKQLVPNRSRYVSLLWNREKGTDNKHTFRCLNIICLTDVSNERMIEINKMDSEYIPVKVVKVLGQSNINNFDGGNTALGHLYRDILYFAEIISNGNVKCRNYIDSWILPNGLFQKTPIAQNLLSVKYLQNRRDENDNQKAYVPDVKSEQPIIADMVKVFEDKLGYPLNYANCEILTDKIRTFNPNTVYLLTSSMIPLVNHRRGCLVKWNKRSGPDTLYWMEGLGSVRLCLRE